MTSPSIVLCDLALADDLRTRVMVPAVNRSRRGIDEIVASDHTLTGLGDSGAHGTSINNFSSELRAGESGATSGVCCRWRTTSVPAELLGLVDRGRLAVGMPADICVFDAEVVAPGRVRTVHDLPGGAARLSQHGVGSRAVLVNGVPTVVGDEPTGAGPGRALRVGSTVGA